jgi:hypothetical protein
MSAVLHVSSQADSARLWWIRPRKQSRRRWVRVPLSAFSSFSFLGFLQLKDMTFLSFRLGDRFLLIRLNGVAKALSVIYTIQIN